MLGTLMTSLHMTSIISSCLIIISEDYVSARAHSSSETNGKVEQSSLIYADVSGTRRCAIQTYKKTMFVCLTASVTELFLISPCFFVGFLCNAILAY